MSFPCLEEVEIKECETRLTSMFPSSQLQDEEYPLFPHQKVVQNMKRFTCDGKFAKMVWDGQIPDNYFSNLEEVFLYLDDDDDESVDTTIRRGLYQSKFPNLQKLEFKGDEKPPILFSSSSVELEPPRDNEAVATFKTLVFEARHFLEQQICIDDTEPAFLCQNLQTLDISGCPNLINLGPSLIYFTNLREIIVSYCDKMTSLLVPSTSRGLSQLTRLTITDCCQMKEVVAEQQVLEEDGGDGTTSGREIIVFQKLESLELEYLPCLRSFCNSNDHAFSFPSLAEVIIRKCPGMIIFCQGDVHTPNLKGVTLEERSMGKQQPHWEGSLNQTIQYFLLSQVKGLELCPEMRSLWMEKRSQRMAFSRLEDLTVESCDFLSECVIPTHLVASLRRLKVLVVRNCQYIKTIFCPEDGCKWFQSLQKLHVTNCKSLEYIFMGSAAKGFEDNESLEEKSSKFLFARLESLKLEKLPYLKGFCLQRCTFECPQLAELRVSQCENITAFGTEMARIITNSGERDELEQSQTHLFLAEKVIPNIERLSLSKKDVTLIKNHQFETNLFDEVEDLTLGGFVGGESAAAAASSLPFDFLERFPKLLRLRVEHSAFEEIFSSQPQQHTFCSSLEELELAYLEELNAIWNHDDHSSSSSSSQFQPLHLNLESLKVDCCPNLIMLVPASASLANLTHLKVSGCHQLTYLFTDSTAKSLVYLETLAVKECRKMKEIVRNESEEDAAGITLNGLRKLELDALPSFEGFCLKNQTFQFPDLTGVTIKGCHQMKMFSLGDLETPQLEGVDIDDSSMRLKRDLNKTIELFVSKKVPKTQYKA
ncbi:unnamed protein product [Cuscuta campestris]|nr:unnamed protein product [Cuscuta campestris]